MAWNPSPKVADCRALASKHGANKVVLVLVNEGAGTMEVVSYGATKRQCDEAKRLADDVWAAAMEHFDEEVEREPTTTG